MLSINSAISQYYDLGQEPSKTKWKQINTEHFQIIFPDTFRSEAQRLANMMDYVYFLGSKTLNHPPQKVPIIIHNQSIVSNAYVVWAPRRMEFTTCTPQSTYTQDWLEQLVLHEFRHVVQTDKLNNFLYYIAGEQMIAAIEGLYTPLWLMEGDAVCTETAMSNSGRGRDPKFELEARANTLENRIFNFDKASLGSYKDFVPDIYPFGYLYVANVRRRYGSEAWEKGMNYSEKRPYLITPLNHGLKEVTGLSKRKLYLQTFKDLDSMWKQQQSKIKFSEFKVVSPKNNIYTNYQFPTYLNDDSTIIAVKSGIGDIAHIITFKPNGKEKTIITPGFYSVACLSPTTKIDNLNNKNGEAPLLSVCNDIIVWSEVQFDKRWINRTYSVIKKYDLKTKNKSTLTKKTRLFAPSITKDGSKIVAVETSEINKNSLVIIDAISGKEIKRFSTINNDFFITPTWSEDSKKIAVINMNKKGKGIILIDFETLDYKVIQEETITEIYRPLIKNNYIFYDGIYSGIQNIYAVNINTIEIFQVTSSKHAAVSIAFSKNGNKMIYSDYSADGYRIAEAKYDESKWIKLNAIENNFASLYKGLLKQETSVNFDSIKYKDYEIKNYKKSCNLFNFHSWAPATPSEKLSSPYAYPGVLLLSQNKLSTAFTTIEYNYNIVDKTNKYSASFIYKGWYPIIETGADYGNRRNPNVSSNEYLKSWNELNLKANIRVPFNFSVGKMYKLIEPSVGFNYIDIENNFKTTSLNYRFYAYNIQKSSLRDMRSQFGQAFCFNYRKISNYSQNNILSLQAYTLFPGFFKHHSFKIDYEYQKNNSVKFNNYIFDNIINLPRGYAFTYSKEISKFSFDYKLPLLYPDFNAGSIIYVKRIKLNLFSDMAEITDNTLNNSKFISYGGELTADAHVLRFLIPLDFGVRCSVIPTQKNIVKWEFLIALNLNGL